MAKRGGTYSSDKRRKELQRQKKKEDKRLKKLKGTQNPAEVSNETAQVNPETEASESTTQETE